MLSLETEITRKITTDLPMSEKSQTGIARMSVLSQLKSASMINFLTVDIMHDIYEGVREYDWGLLLHHLIIQKKFLSICHVL